MKCKGIDRNNNSCRKYAINNDNFCKLHEYLKNYTDDMIKNMKLCSGCNKWIYLKPGEICGFCVIGRKQRKDKQIKCKKDTCKSKSLQNGYCGKHKILFLEEIAEKEGYKICSGRGCVAKLLMNDHSKCRNCLDKDNEYDRNRRNKIKEDNNSIVKSIKINNDIIKSDSQNTGTNHDINDQISINLKSINSVTQIKPKIVLKKSLSMADQVKKIINDIFSSIDFSLFDPIVEQRKVYFYNLVDNGIIQ